MRDNAIHVNTKLSEPQRRIWLRDDIIALSKCEGIVMLRSWETSTGAMAEFYWANAVKMECFYWVKRSHRERLSADTCSSILCHSTADASEWPSQ